MLSEEEIAAAKIDLAHIGMRNENDFGAGGNPLPPKLLAAENDHT